MICYTNHALDQFLEYCIKECGINSGVVRVGGRSKSEILKPFLLQNIKQKMRDERKIDINIYNAIRKQRELLESIEKRLDNLNNLLKSSLSNGILIFSLISNFMTLNQQYYFDYIFKLNSNKSSKRSKDFELLEWLGILIIDNLDLNYLYSIEKQSTNFTFNDQENLSEEDDYFESLNDERMLEGDFDSAVLTKKYAKNKKKKSKEFDVLLGEEEIFEMIIDYNQYHGSRKLEQFLKLHNKNKQFVTTTSNKKEKKTNQEESKPFNQFVNNYLKSIFDIKLGEHDKDYEKNKKVGNLDALTYTQRFRLYREWLDEYIKSQEEMSVKLNKEYNLNAHLLKELRMQEDLFVMKNAHILAMTTTGSSRYHNVLKDLGPRIVIIEEAAEVFEAHIVSSLSKHCEHLILIGDHVQLRPNPSVYKLAVQYHLDVSLFERLINNNIKQVMLTCQHRMRPEISILMKHFYPKPILNHESVEKFEKIIGLTKNIYFLNHNKLENSLKDTQSKLNYFEVEFLAQFCLYLMKQKYNESQITILTMYLGQMTEIRKRLRMLKLNHGIGF